MPKRYGDETRRKVVELLNSGATYDQIRSEIGCSNALIRAVRREYQNEITDIRHKGGAISTNLAIAPKLPAKEVPVKNEELKPASLVVFSRIIVLGGLKTKDYQYRVDPIERRVTIIKSGETLTMSFSDISGIIEELEAIQKNLPPSEGPMEVW